MQLLVAAGSVLWLELLPSPSWMNIRVATWASSGHAPLLLAKASRACNPISHHLYQNQEPDILLHPIQPKEGEE
jgi:hypothetical protein